jgi:hypothetical protein
VTSHSERSVAGSNANRDACTYSVQHFIAALAAFVVILRLPSSSCNYYIFQCSKQLHCDDLLAW